MNEDLRTVHASGGLLVGHDGSTFADEALRWALAMARRLGTSVTVVRAWVMTTAPRPPSWSRGYVPPMADYAEAVAAQLRVDTEAVRERYADMEVTCQAVHGAAAHALVSASENVELLVVGPRGVGGFRGLVLGSVSEQCVRHSACPVVVVPASDVSSDGSRSVVLDAGLSDDA